MFELYFTGFVLLCMIILLASEITEPAFIVFGALITLTLSGIINIDEAFKGFSNHGMLTVGFLYIISAGLQSSGLFIRTIYRLLGDKKNGTTKRYLRFLFSVAGLSAFLNNTPIVASLIPIVKKWAKKYDISPSKYLLPLSYAAILGGMCTLIGTSTNLVVHGLMQEQGLGGLGFFEITKVGLPVAVIMIFLLSTIGHYLLPERREVVTKLEDNYRKYVAEVKVKENYPHLGETVEEADLRGLKGLFLFQITRNGKKISPVGPDEKIYKRDRLFFTGKVDTIYELQKTRGLSVTEDLKFEDMDSDDVNTYEAVVSRTSPLVGMTVRESNFRERYNGVILAIHRAGHRIDQKVGDIVLQPSDTLFILAEKDFEEIWSNSQEFNLISSSIDIYEKPKWKGDLALFLLFLMIILAATGTLPILLAAALTAMVMVATDVINFKIAQKAINWEVLAIIASSFGIAQGLTNSGFADFVANGIVDIFSVFGDVGIIAGLFLAISSFTWVITNNAVAAIMFPVTMALAQTVDIGTEPFILTLVLGASTCFATPIGYQTNTMVYGTGNYKIKDFIKIGLPMNISVAIIVTALINFLYL